MTKHNCAVCGKEITLDDCFNCFTCGWDSDPVQEADPNYRGGANKCSLNEAKAAWLAKSTSSEPKTA